MSMTTPTETPDSATGLSRKIWVTRGCRFAAHRRLNRRHVWSTWAIAALSVYVIAASIFAQFIPQTTLSPAVLNAGLIVASVLVLVLSLIEAGRSYQLRAEHLHRCAVDLGKLESKVVELQSLPLATGRADQIARLSRRYAATLEACPDNHEKLDYDTFRAEHRKDYEISWATRIGMWLFRELHTVGPYVLAILTPPALVYALSLLPSQSQP